MPALNQRAFFIWRVVKSAVRQLLFGSQFTPAKLFLGDAPGVWFDRQDLSSMYQDAAGTTACAVGSPVGLALDKSKGAVRGAEQVVNGATPIVGTTGWTAGGSGTPSLAQAGGVLTLTAGTVGSVVATNDASLTGGVTYELIVNVTAKNAVMVVRTAGGGLDANPLNLNVGLNRFIVTPSVSGAINVGNVGSVAAGSNISFNLVSAKPIPGNHATQGTAASRPILRQDASGRYYLEYDGVDDGYATGNVDFTGTDEVTVVSGLYKASDAAVGVYLELGASGSAGSFSLFAPASIGSTFGFRTIGSSLEGSVASAAGFAAPASAVVTGQGRISTDTRILRVNGAQVATSALDQGAGALQNAALWIGRRGGTTSPFNGRDYGLIVVGRALTATEIARAERFLAGRTGVTL